MNKPTLSIQQLLSRVNFNFSRKETNILKLVHKYHVFYKSPKIDLWD